MFFLIRMAFWLTVVLVLLPSGGSQSAKSVSFSASDAVSAASAAFSDMRRFCERQREACEVGSQAAVVIGERAQAGAKMLYELINEQLAPTTTGSVASGNEQRVPLPVARPSQNTLTPTDLAPVWRGPQARKHASDGSV